VLCFAAVNSTHAQDLKIGVVNFARLLEQSPQFEAMQQKLREEFQPRQREIVAKQQELQKKAETFQRDAAVMGEEERLSLEREIRDGQRDLQRAENEFREDANIRQNEEVSKLNRALLQQAQSYARGADYDLVVADAVYFSEAIDITADVLALLRESGGE
jgi:outer membrane protein